MKPSHQTSKHQRLKTVFPCICAPSEKCRGRNCKCRCKIIIRDIAQQVGEKWFVQLRQKQDRDAHLERKGVGAQPSKEESHKEPIKSFIQGSSSGSLSSFRPIFWFLSPHLTYPGTLPWDVHAPLNQDGSRSEGFWEEQDSLSLALSLDFWLKRRLSAHVQCLPCSKRRWEGDILIFYSNRILPPLCPCHDHYLEVFTRDKH